MAVFYKSGGGVLHASIVEALEALAGSGGPSR